ncbi:FecR domain-containing protein [Hymenobacter sp. BT770]|uniref:FecR family protein n=1 Tax=Hymenobacter sp. BT770 TaxID=2886942 RepID=UPI001D1140AF|nr:FecR domain-containing protein [Hymenobacter sp. BT770]MCC3155236.1 FecR domain-containing protein [Hymenobacter sp. BT770]MDO3417191.1 FecR domain-containing protein [Hymenobacter sp. BT770]
MTHKYPDPVDAPWALLARHLAAEATASERADLRAWVQADPTHLQILTTVTRAWERAAEAAPTPVLFSPADVEAAWQRFRPLMTTAVYPTPTARPVATPLAAPAARPMWPLQRRAAARRWQLVAGLALLLGAGFVLAKTGLFKPREHALTYASADARRMLRLPDGSTVWLNAHSRLRYAGAGPAPARGLRAVQLTGEAYFEVQHHPSRPFVVSTATARVRVTGTAFNVRAYAAEDSVEVSVTHGRVWLTHVSAADSVQLPAGTRAALHAADAPGRIAARLQSRPAADPNFRAWQTDTLHFADVPVSQVARTLRATFGTAVQLSSPGLGQCRFTGTFPHPQPAQVLAVLAAATASRLEPDGRGGYQLQGPGCGAPIAAPAPATPAPGRE